MMEQFDFLLGDWDMKSNIPKSAFSEEAATGLGRGTFKRALKDKYVFFDYVSVIDEQEGQAHGVFVWDEKINMIRYFWFENSGNFLTATCHFVNEKILFMNWHDTLLKQTFKKINPNKVELRMESPDSDGNYELILEVIFTKKS